MAPAATAEVHDHHEGTGPRLPDNVRAMNDETRARLAAATAEDDEGTTRRPHRCRRCEGW